MRLVNAQIVVNVIFGEVDDQGNLINKQPVSVEIPKLDHASFTAACDSLVEARNKANGAVATATQKSE